MLSYIHDVQIGGSLTRPIKEKEWSSVGWGSKKIYRRENLVEHIMAPEGVFTYEYMKDSLWYLLGSIGASGFGSKTTAEDVTKSLDLSSTTIIITGMYITYVCHPKKKSASQLSYILCVWNVTSRYLQGW